MKQLRPTLVAALVLVALGCRSSGQGPDAALAKRLDPLLHQLDASGAIVSARVIELPSRRELYATDNIDSPLTPASNMKLQTAAAALDLLGPDHVFKTYLALDGDNLWLVGTGDPATGDPAIAEKRGEARTAMLDRWADALTKRGVTRVRGKLYFYDGAFESQTVHPTWSKSFLVDWYAAPVTGLNFNDNCVDITMTPAENGQPATYAVEPPVKSIKIINQSVTGGEGTLAIDRELENNVYTIKGGVKEKKKLESKPVTDPGAFFADALRTNFESHGITIDGPTERAPRPLDGTLVPPAAKIIAVNDSKMTDVMWRICKNSQNAFAEALCKYEGREFEKRNGKDVAGSWANGAAAVREFLRKNHIDDSQFVMVDGSGLARGNKVTTRLITELLATMHVHPYHEAFFNSLAVAGVDGTIRARMKDLVGHVYGKTGFVGGVRALSGYVKTSEGRWLAFSIIYNQLPGSVKVAEELQDDACRVLVEYPHVERAELKSTTRPATTMPTTAATTNAS